MMSCDEEVFWCLKFHKNTFILKMHKHVETFNNTKQGYKLAVAVFVPTLPFSK